MLPYVTVAVRAVNEPATEADFVRFPPSRWKNVLISGPEWPVIEVGLAL
jgi:hypothetical protein